MESELYTVVDENNNEARKEADFNSSEVVFQDSELFDNGDSKENVSKKDNKNFDTCDTHKENGKYSVTGQGEDTSGDCIHTEVKVVLSKKQQNSELDFEKLVTAYVKSIKVRNILEVRKFRWRKLFSILFISSLKIYLNYNLSLISA